MPNTAPRLIAWAAIALILMLAVEGILRPRGLTLDFANFYDAGQKARAGEFAGLYDPFAVIAGQKPFGNMSFFSAPLTSYFYAPMAMLPPVSASLVFKLSGTLAEMVGLVLLYRCFAPLAGPDPDQRARFLALYAVAALLFQPFWVIYGVGGQTTPFVFLMLVLAYVALQHGWFGRMAVLMSVVVVIKPAFAPAAILLFLALPNRFRLVALICGMGFGVASFRLFGPDLHRQFLALVLAETSGLLAPWRNSSPFSWIEPLFVLPAAYDAPGTLPDAARRIETVARILVATWLLIGMILHRRQVLRLPADRHAIFATAMMLAIVLSPVVWAHYLVLLFIPLAASIALRRRLASWAVALLVVAVVVAVGQNLILLKALIRVTGTDTTASIMALALLKSLPAMLILLVAMFGGGGNRRALADPAWAKLAD